jgi:hypothetical protein
MLVCGQTAQEDKMASLIQGGKPNIPMLYLSKEDIDYNELPMPHVITMIAMLVPRLGDMSRPGFVVLPNVADLFANTRYKSGRVSKVENFQHVLMLELLSYLKERHPMSLAPQPYLDLPEKEAKRHYAKAEPGISMFVVPGTTSFKYPHMDSLQHVLISLCYYPRQNVSGGTPLLFDLHKAGADAGEITDKFPGIRLYHEKELVVFPRKGHYASVRRTQMKLDTLDYSKMPIVIASNRIEDGIMHGATPVRKIDASKRWSRPISYVAIKCM